MKKEYVFGGFVLISYSDAFAAQFVFEKSAPLVTGGPEFKSLEKEGLIDILWISK